MNPRWKPFRPASVPRFANAILGVSVLLAGEVLAEGAVRTLDCSLARLCDASGSCVAETGEIVFRMEPTDVSADGSGRYTLSYRDTSVAMTALSSAGPFVWTTGQDRHTLLASSERQFLWHRLTLAPAPEADIRFLVCTFSQ